MLEELYPTSINIPAYSRSIYFQGAGSRTPGLIVLVDISTEELLELETPIDAAINSRKGSIFLAGNKKSQAINA